MAPHRQHHSPTTPHNHSPSVHPLNPSPPKLHMKGTTLTNTMALTAQLTNTTAAPNSTDCNTQPCSDSVQEASSQATYSMPYSTYKPLNAHQSAHAISTTTSGTRHAPTHPRAPSSTFYSKRPSPPFSTTMTAYIRDSLSSYDVNTTSTSST